MNTLSIGFGQADITPWGQTALIGQYKTRIAQEVYTPLKAVAIGSEGSQSVYWTACDLLYVTDTLIDAICDRIKEACPELDIFDVQLTDDYHGYLPTRQAVRGGGYSAMLFNGSCQPESGDQLVEECVCTLKEQIVIHRYHS